jgi:hypothetical protein
MADQAKELAMKLTPGFGGLFILVLLAGLCSNTGPASAYPIVASHCKADPVACAKEGKLDAVSIFGHIGYEDLTFFEAIDEAIPADKSFPTIYVDSEGGSGYVGTKIGRILRKRHATVESGSPFIPDTLIECSSACAFVVAGATTRIVDHIGVHQGHLSFFHGPRNWHDDPVPDEATEEDFAYFSEMGIDPEIKDIIKATPSDRMANFYFVQGEPETEQKIVQLGFRNSNAVVLTPLKKPASEDDMNEARENRYIAAIHDGSNAAIHDYVRAILHTPLGYKPDYESANKWLQIGADRNDPTSLHNLAVNIAYGKGTKVNMGLAVQYFLRAARLGLAASQNNVGWHYYKGDGIKRSIPDAVFWITRSAEQGEPFAYGSLCEMYGAGDTFAKDNVEAYKWCKLAVDQEPDGQVKQNDVKILERFKHKLTPQDVEIGDTLVTGWKPLKPTNFRMRDKADG